MQNVPARGCLGCVGSFTAIIWLLAILGIMNGAPQAYVPLSFFGLLLLAVTIWLALVAQQQGLVDCEIKLDPGELALGEHLNVSIQVVAKKRVPLTTATITLICREKAISRGGTSDTTYYHNVHEDTRPVEVNQELSEGMPWFTSASFQVPPELPATFVGKNNFIEWLVQVHIGLKGVILDIRRDEHFRVRNEIA